MPITIAPLNAVPPTKAYVNACWAQTPTLNPAAFREVLGHTIGMLWLDLRTALPHQDILLTAWRHGLNGWLLSPRTLASLELPESIHRDTLVLALDTTTTQPTQPVDLFFWRSNQPNVESLTQLEHHARNGHLTAYGVAAATPPALHEWLAAAEQATEKVYGRRKRPALRALLAPLGLTHTEFLHQPTSLNHNENISALEFAARLGWATVAAHPTDMRRADGLMIPLTAQSTPPATALAALEKTAAAEQALHQHLQGWPIQGGQHLFSLLAHLGAGAAPFPSPANGLAWATALLPDILLTWQRLQTSQPAAPIAPYIENLQKLAFHAQTLGHAAAAGTTQRLFSNLNSQPGIVKTPKTDTPAAVALHLATSLPGVAGALVNPQNLAEFLPLMQTPAHPDPSTYFPA